MSNARKSLKERAKEFKVSLPFMDGREKGDVKSLIGTVSTITEYGFLKDDDSRSYGCFIVAERKNEFYFAGAVLTDQLEQLEAEGYHEEISTNGLPVLLTEKKSKNGRTYMNVEFYPDEE